MADEDITIVVYKCDDCSPANEYDVDYLRGEWSEAEIVEKLESI